MSVVDQIKKLFSKKDFEQSVNPSGELSLAMPDASPYPTVTGSMDAARSPVAVTGGEERPADPDSIADADSTMALDEADEAELISVPLLGRRRTATHQRTLFTFLALALVALGSVAIFAVREADQVAQRVAVTGQSLMQSQRLAKSVSQALVGSAHLRSQLA